MYYTHLYYDAGIGDYRGQILSAVSTDGLAWIKEPGIRINYGGTYDSISISSSGVIRLPDGTFRMYYDGYDGTHYRILSAVSVDGLVWTKEAGIRIDVGGTYDSLNANTPLPLMIADGTYMMFYCGSSAQWTGQILSAVSVDGLVWTKEAGIRIERGSYAVVVPSEIIQLSASQYRMYITADRYPVWQDRMRILSANGTIQFAIPPYGPKSSFTATPEAANVGQAIAFNGSTSTPGWNGTLIMPIIEYRWDFGDGNKITTSTSTVFHSFSSPGIYYITLTVYAPGATPETNSTSYRVTVAAVPVGGYSLTIRTPTTANPSMFYVALVALLSIGFTAVKRNTRRKTQ
jgi:hypothetical protein